MFQHVGEQRSDCNCGREEGVGELFVDTFDGGGELHGGSGGDCGGGGAGHGERPLRRAQALSDFGGDWVDFDGDNLDEELDEIFIRIDKEIASFGCEVMNLFYWSRY